MIKAKIAMMTNNSKKEFIKEFNNISSFNDYKDSRLSGNTSYFKYQLMYQGEIMYGPVKTEYSNVKHYIKQDKVVDNTAQKKSRNNQLAVQGNKLINLNMTPSRQRALVKWMNKSPLTTSEIKFVKSMFAFDKISIAQYNSIEELKNKVSRRVRI